MITAAIKAKLVQVGAGVLVALLLAAGAAVLYYRAEADRQRARANRNWFSADSASAAADVTRRISDRNETLRKVLQVGFAAAQRQAIQQEQRGDSLDRALGLERVAVADLTVQVAQLKARLTSTAPVVQSPEGVRSASFLIDSTPFRGSLKVELPAPPARGTMDIVSLGVDPAKISHRVSCDRADEQGGRRALVTYTTPAWLTLSIDRAEQSQEVCNQQLVTATAPRFTTSALRRGRDAIFIYGLIDLLLGVSKAIKRE